MQDPDKPAVCSICHLNPHKYRCPSHPSVRTCSLPCYKKHRERAACTGERNQANYLKRKELATSEGIDHDFNFLTKIERALDQPTALAQPAPAHGKTPFAPQSVRDDHQKKRRKDDRGLATYCTQHNITLLRAPDVMSRSKTNDTRFLPKSRKVAWTVEWVESDGNKTLTEVLEDTRIEDAYRSVTGKRKREPTRRSSQSGASSSSQNPATSSGHAPATSPTSPPDTDPVPTPTSTKLAAASPALHFYIQTPRTLFSTTVLRPVKGSDSMTHCLQNATIEEFPTVFALAHPPASLPPPLFLPADYEARYGERLKRVQSLSAPDMPSSSPSQRVDHAQRPARTEERPRHGDAHRHHDDGQHRSPARGGGGGYSRGGHGGAWRGGQGQRQSYRAPRPMQQQQQREVVDADAVLDMLRRDGLR